LYYTHSTTSQERSRILRSQATAFPQYPDTGNSLTLNAVWDTGAVSTCVNSLLCKQCSIRPYDFSTFWGVSGPTKVGIAKLAIKLPNGLVIRNKRVAICDLHPNTDLLIGMDIIALGDFCISNSDGKTLFSFIVPSLPTPVNLAEMAA
jgi:hypothetical protein